MKPVHIIILVILGVAVAIIVSVFGNASAYKNFEEAQKMAADGNSSDIHIVGMLPKDANNNIIDLVYEPTASPIVLKFPLIDDKGHKEIVTIYDYPKPAEFSHAEKIVVIGSYKKDTFIASQILLKCPSKYEDKEFKEAK